MVEPHHEEGLPSKKGEISRVTNGGEKTRGKPRMVLLDWMASGGLQHDEWQHIGHKDLPRKVDNQRRRRRQWKGQFHDHIVLFHTHIRVIMDAMPSRSWKSAIGCQAI